MGTYIHAYAERRTSGQWFPASIDGVVEERKHASQVLDWQSYTLFGWLADVRNYAKIPPLAKKRGLPDCLSADLERMADDARMGGHGSFSWLALRELVDFDYDATFQNRRTGNGDSEYGDTFPLGMGYITTYREEFGQRFFDELEKLKSLGDIDNTRIVFWFD